MLKTNMLFFKIFLIFFLIQSCLIDPHSPSFENEYLDEVSLTDNKLFYHFNEGAYNSNGSYDIIDSSGLGKNSETLNSPFSVSGVFGNGIELNGINQCIILRPNDFDSSFTSRTISLWFKANDLNGTQILYEEGGSVNGQNIYLYENQLFGGVYKSQHTDLNAYIQTTTTANTWHHVANVFDENDGFKVYYDGELVNTLPTGMSFPSHSDPNAIGCVQSAAIIHDSSSAINTGYYFNGVIDEFAFWDRALSADEIKVIFQRQGRY